MRIKKLEPTPEVPVVAIELTAGEAKMLRAFVGCVGGDPEFSVFNLEYDRFHRTEETTRGIRKVLFDPMFDLLNREGF